MKHAHETYDWPPRQSLVIQGRPANGTSARAQFGQREPRSLSSRGAAMSRDTGFGFVMFAADCVLWIVMAAIVLAGTWFFLTTIRVS